MESIYSDPAIDIIISEEGNSLCNDCKQPDPKWASVNNAVFICTKCARKHQKLGRLKSFIKSIEVDNWEKGEILLLKHGGNLRFQNLLNEYRIPLLSDVEYKYNTKATNYYRKILSNEVKEINIEIEKPELKIGIQLDDEDEVMVNVPKEAFELNQMPPETNKRKVENDFDEIFKSIGSMFTDISHGINDAIKEKKWDVKFKEKSEVALQFAKESKEFIKEKSKDVVESNVFQRLKQKAETGFELMREKATELIENTNNVENESYNTQRQFFRYNNNPYTQNQSTNQNQSNNQVYLSMFNNNSPGNDDKDTNIP